MTESERIETAIDYLIGLAFVGPPDCDEINVDSEPKLSDEDLEFLERIDIKAIIHNANDAASREEV